MIARRRKTWRRADRRQTGWDIATVGVGLSFAVMIAFLIVIALVHFAHAKDIRITYDTGGSVYNYATYYRAHRADRFVIDGYCGSSCTLALALPRTCVTKRSSLGFHQAYEWAIWPPGSKHIDVGLSSYFMSQYPRGIRNWINRNGGLAPDIKLLKGNGMRALVPNC